MDALTQRGSLPPRVADQLQALSGRIANGIQGFTRTQVGKIAHDELVKALTGEGGGAITVGNDTVSVNPAAFIQAVKAQLVAAGFTLAERIPAVDASFVLSSPKTSPYPRVAVPPDSRQRLTPGRMCGHGRYCMAA